MIVYKNVNGNSNVVAYEFGEDSITVQFKSGAHTHYLYDANRPGLEVVNQMKRLAEQGHGLNSFIGRVVKANFSKKW